MKVSEKNRQLLRTMAEAVEMLPDSERKYIMGYAEGVISMGNHLRESSEATTTDGLDMPSTQTA